MLRSAEVDGKPLQAEDGEKMKRIRERERESATDRARDGG